MDKRYWLLGRVITPAEVVEQGAVGIDGESIRYAGPAADAPRAPRDPVRSVEGWITPGLIDLHVHGAGGRDLMEGTGEAIAAVSRILAAHGTTSYVPTSVVFRDIPSNRHLAAASEVVGEFGEGAQVLGLHVEGPFVNPVRAGMIRHDRIWPPDRDDLSQLIRLTHGKLTMMTLAPEMPGMLDLLPFLADSGVIPSMGHTDATFDQARAGFKRGIRHVTHLYNAMRGLHHREPGALGAVLMDHGVTAQLIADGIHVHPEVLRWTLQTLSADALVLITDALPSAGLPDGTYSYDGRSYESRNGSAFNSHAGHSTLFGTTLLLDELVRRAVQWMGVSFQEAIAMASLHPARTLGMEKRIGQLVRGAQADLVIWDESFLAEETLIAGRTVWKREEACQHL